MNASAHPATTARRWRPWTAVSVLIGDWRRRVRDRESLAQLTLRERLDMGLTRAAVEDEIRKPIWRA